jgi:Ca-activated chloride channel family protein
MTARTLGVALLLSLLGVAQPRTQTVQTLRFISPPSGSYVTGPVLLKVGFDGEGGGSAIDDVTFFADGKQICVAPGSRMECEWDAGRTVEEHAFRAVARLRAGGRVIANIRTRAIAFAESASVDIVQVNAVVTDGGRFVKGLTKDAFRLLDDKEERPIVGFDPNGAPLELVLALDVSGSMKDALLDVQDAARSFLKALGPKDRVTVVAFNDGLFTLAPREADLQARLQALDKLSAWGGTAVYDVIIRSIDQLSKKAGRRAFVIFTDGEDQSSQASLEDVVRAVSDSDATVFAVGLGRGEKMKAIKANLGPLAEASGGLVLLAEHSDMLTETFTEIVADLANQYTLGFEPRRDGKSHSVTVQVPGRGVRVRARRGYVAPVAQNGSPR